MKSLFQAFALMAVGVSAVCGAHAQGLYGISDSSRELFHIDPTTLAVTTIGSTGVASGDFGDLAWDAATSTMYWVAGRRNDNLYTINLTTGAATLVGSHGIGDNFTLGFNGLDLYAQSTNGTVYTLDEMTGAATPIGSNGVYPGGYDWNSATNQMVLLEAGGGSLHSIGTGTGAATLLSGGAGFVNDNDIAYDADRNVYWAYDYNGSLYQYDAVTYNRTHMLGGLGSGASLEYVSGAQQAVPEPGTIALLMGMGVSGLVAVRRRRR